VKKEKEGLGHKLWEAAVAAAAKVLENKHDEVATRVPLSGRIGDTQPDIWATVGGLLRNAFIHALAPGLERGGGGGAAADSGKKS